MLILENLQNNCTIELIVEIIYWIKRCSDESTGFSLYRLNSMNLKCWEENWKISDNIWKSVNKTMYT